MVKKISLIKPKIYKSPDVRKDLYNAVDIVANSESPAIGYAFVSFHADKSSHSYWNVENTHISPFDLPDMVRSRLMIKVAHSSIPNKENK